MDRVLVAACSWAAGRRNTQRLSVRAGCYAGGSGGGRCLPRHAWRYFQFRDDHRRQRRELPTQLSRTGLMGWREDEKEGDRLPLVESRMAVRGRSAPHE
eukprot:SAG22_NODE_2931_length_2096_cov_1.806710_2_plen_99_part_00